MNLPCEIKLNEICYSFCRLTKQDGLFHYSCTICTNIILMFVRVAHPVSFLHHLIYTLYNVSYGIVNTFCKNILFFFKILFISLKYVKDTSLPKSSHCCSQHPSDI